MLAILLTLYYISQNLPTQTWAVPLHIIGSRALPEPSSLLETCVCEAAEGRTLFDIAYSCIVTIFACTWIAMHPNVPPDDRWITTTGRRICVWIYALILPEFIVYWALSQWHTAGEYAKIYKGRGWTRTHGFFLLMGGFILHDETSEDSPPRALSTFEFDHLVKENRIVFPTITEGEIKDRSKGDILAKTIVLLQTLWFVAQIIARARLGLVVTELEVVTLALATLNGIIYFLWWHKPLDVNTPVPIYIINAEEVKSLTDDEVAPENNTELKAVPVVDSNAVVEAIPEVNILPLGASSSGVEEEKLEVLHKVNALHASAESLPSILPPSLPSSEKTLFQRIRISVLAVVRNIKYQCSRLKNLYLELQRKEIEESGLALFILSFIFSIALLPIFIMLAMGYFFGKPLPAASGNHHGTSTDFEGVMFDSRGVPMFFAPERDNWVFRVYYIAFGVGALFGSIHCIAWAFSFPTPSERLLWRLSAVYITAYPMACILLLWLLVVFKADDLPDDPSWGQNRARWFMNVCIGFFYLLGIALYTIARLYLIVDAAVALRKLDEGALKDVEWSQFFPHF
ncbi:hypothetical protein B0H34DRAFT_801835 [Crassisporium funariophilum]|nr:hypothetical protein B0H34DRAFT_801835 [Crassisporium funariophilum]